MKRYPDIGEVCRPASRQLGRVRSAESESAVLPLNYSPFKTLFYIRFFYEFSNLEVQFSNIAHSGDPTYLRHCSRSILCTNFNRACPAAPTSI